MVIPVSLFSMGKSDLDDKIFTCIPRTEKIPNFSQYQAPPACTEASNCGKFGEEGGGGGEGAQLPGRKMSQLHNRLLYTYTVVLHGGFCTN